MEQTRKSHTTKAQVREAEEITVPKNEEVEAHKAEIDDLLDAIDAILEENAETFVAGFVQKGGQ